MNRFESGTDNFNAKVQEQKKIYNEIVCLCASEKKIIH